MGALDAAAHAGSFAFERAAVIRVAVPMREPFRISSGEVDRKEAVLLRLGDEKCSGWGESSAMGGTFYGPETPDGCEKTLVDDVLPRVLGRRFSSLLELESELAAATPNRFVRVAAETAAWDFVARRKGVSLRSLLGIPSRPVPSGLAVGLYADETALSDALRRYDPKQYKRLKLKIKHGQDVSVVDAGRRILGDFPMFVDANADYSIADKPVFEELDRKGLMMFEQPLGRHDLAGCAELQRAVKTPICLDESAETADETRRFIEAGACGVINIKLQRVGGYLEALRIIEVCEPHGIPLWMGTMPELGIGSAQALMLAAHPAFRFPTDVEPSARWFLDDIIQPRLELRDGCLHLPDGPGVGFSIDPEKLQKYTVHSKDFAV